MPPPGKRELIEHLHTKVLDQLILIGDVINSLCYGHECDAAAVDGAGDNII